MKTEYVVGFMFDKDYKYVALIRKNKPAWQAGLLNGIGGKSEDRETALLAMVREFAEETAHETSCSQWSHFADMGADSWCVSFFATTGDLNALRSNEEEKIEIAHLRDFHPTYSGAIENLPWLLSLAIDHLKDGRPNFTNVIYPN